MNRFIIIGAIFFVTLLLILTGCKEEPAKTTKWYRDHPDELKVVYEKCQKTGSNSENCRNANKAHLQTEDASGVEFHN